MPEEQDIQLLFSSEGLPEESGYVSKGGVVDRFKGFATGIDQITEWFHKYKVDSVELWISGAVETNGVLKLLVSAKGEGGMKITLTPKPTNQ